MNKTTIICLLALCLLPSCAVQMICPAYQSAFILDEDARKDTYSLFTVFEGDTVPKRPYGYRYKADDGDSLMEKFIKGTSGKGFRVQRGKVHPFEKSGFSYPNKVNEKLWVKVFKGKEKPVLENPYLFDRITKKKPFYKLDHLETKLVHFNRTKYDSLIKQKVNWKDTAAYDLLVAEMNEKPTAIQVQYAPLLRAGFNQEQEAYNKRFARYFLKPAVPVEVDSAELMAEGDTLAADTTQAKKGMFGMFKKKNKKPKEPKPDKPKKEKKKDRKKNNDQGVLPEEENG